MDFKEENLSTEEMFQLCCQADAELLGKTEVQDKVKQAVRSVPVGDCIPLTRQLLQYITLSVLKIEKVILTSIYLISLTDKCIFMT